MSEPRMTVDEALSWAQGWRERHDAGDDFSHVILVAVVLSEEVERLRSTGTEASYLIREINKMRRVMQDTGAWEQFCKDYAAKYPPGIEHPLNNPTQPGLSHRDRPAGGTPHED